MGDLASGATITGEALITLSIGGTVVNTASASGNNGLSGGSFAILTDEDTATVTVEGVANRPPDAIDDIFSGDEDTDISGSVLADNGGGADSDSDSNLDANSVILISGPSDGTLTLNSDGSFTYSPDADFNGSDSFVYEVCDTEELCDQATATLTVNDVNDPPLANDDSAVTNEDTPVVIDVDSNDTDLDGTIDPASVTITEQPSNGTVSVDPVTGDITYTPDADFNGSDTFEYQACDDDGACDTATVTITVNLVNDAPLAVDDAYTTQQDTTLTVAGPGVLVNDSDVDGDAIVVDSFDAVSQFGGSVSANSDGSFSYTPAPGFAGVDTFTYTISDGNGGFDTATVTITVEARNNRSISVDLQDWTLSGTSLSGVFNITNQSGGYDVQIDDLAIEVQYRVAGGGGWTSVQVVEGSCSFDPSVLFLVSDQQLVNFSGCELAQDIPAGATIRVTAKVHIFGRIKGGGKADGWFLDRLSQGF